MLYHVSSIIGEVSIYIVLAPQSGRYIRESKKMATQFYIYRFYAGVILLFFENILSTVVKHGARLQ
jgi:hypothetical protein